MRFKSLILLTLLLNSLAFSGLTKAASSKALTSLLHAAQELESSSAQYLLGRMYENGQGTERSSENAYQWYLTSANQNFAKAQLKLGQTFEKGLLDQKKNRNIARQWYEKAASQNSINAQYHLGKLLHDARNSDRKSVV